MADTGTNYPLNDMIADLAEAKAALQSATDAEKAAKEIRKEAADKADAITGAILEFLQSEGVYQDTTPLARVSIVKTPPKLVIDNPDAVPDEFYDLTPSRNDAKIKARIASGMEVPGARTEQSETLKVEWKK